MFLLWVAGGLLTWYVALYAFTFILSPVVAPSLKFLKSNISSQTILALSSTFVFHIAEYVLSVIIAALLCYFTGFKPLWFIGFLLGAGAVTFYGQIVGLLEYRNLYPSLPDWVLSWFLQGLVSIFILLPITSWAGCMCGRKLRLKRTAC